MTFLKMPLTQACELYEALGTQRFILDQKNDELMGKDLEICELNVALEELTARATLAGELEQELAQLSAFTECVLRERQAGHEAYQWTYSATKTCSIHEGYVCPIPFARQVGRPDRWYLDA
jgi:hypothetical protein